MPPPIPDINFRQAEPETSDAAKADENAAFSEEGEEEESAEEDLVVEPDAEAPRKEAVPENGEAPETVSLTLASLAQTAEVLLKQGGMGWEVAFFWWVWRIWIWKVIENWQGFMRFEIVEVRLKRKLSKSCTSFFFWRCVFLFHLQQLQDGPLPVIKRGP